MKLVKPELETGELRAWLKELDPTEPLVTSELAELELTRTFIRHGAIGADVAEIVAAVLEDVDVAILSEAVLRRAREYDIAALGTLDSIHLATAAQFGTELHSFVTYDKELIAAARSCGWRVLSPAP